MTIETPGYKLDSDIAFRDVDPNEYLALVLPGGRAPEFLRYDQDLLRITRHFFEHAKPVASICHGIEILAAADVIRGRQGDHDSPLSVGCGVLWCDLCRGATGDRWQSVLLSLQARMLRLDEGVCCRIGSTNRSANA